MSNDPGLTKTPVPWVTLSLISANMVVALSTTLVPEFVDLLAFNPIDARPLSVLSSLFVHNNLVHLLGNMVFLAAVGPKVESVAGKGVYSLLYLVGGLVGVAAHWAVMSVISGTNLLLGASGAIASCAGYCAIRFMDKKVPLAPRLSVTVGAVTLIWVLLQALGFFVRFGENVGGAAFWTHLAGFATGMALSIVFRAPQQASVQSGHEFLDQMGDRSPGALLRAADDHLERYPDDARALRDKATALRLMGDFDQESEVLCRLLEVVSVQEQASLVSRLVETKGIATVPSMQRLKLASSLRAQSPDLSKSVLQTISQGPESDENRADALVALIELSDSGEREALVTELTTRYALHPATAIARAKGLLA